MPRLRHLIALSSLAAMSACGGTSDPIPDTSVATVTLSSSATTIAPGTTVQMSATARTSGGTTLSGLTTTWSSSNQSVATISTSGVVTAVANGNTTIRATISGVIGERVITVATVTPVGAATVDAGTANVFSPAQVNLTVGGTVTWQFGSVEHNVGFGGTSGAPANIGNTSNASVSRTFTTAGTFGYVCSLHSGMSGTVIVQ